MCSEPKAIRKAVSYSVGEIFLSYISKQLSQWPQSWSQNLSKVLGLRRAGVFATNF